MIISLRSILYIYFFCSSHSDWPQEALLVPGNEVIFSLETASDYLNEYNKSNK